jgi:hypothetical protein
MSSFGRSSRAGIVSLTARLQENQGRLTSMKLKPNYHTKVSLMMNENDIEKNKPGLFGCLLNRIDKEREAGILPLDSSRNVTPSEKKHSSLRSNE